MIDDTPVANFNDDGYFDGNGFILEARVDFVSEGAHVIRMPEHYGPLPPGDVIALAANPTVAETNPAMKPSDG